MMRSELKKNVAEKNLNLFRNIDTLKINKSYKAKKAGHKTGFFITFVRNIFYIFYPNRNYMVHCGQF